MNTAKPKITHVSDTAFWVATYRAQETDRADAFFKDPLAKKLAGERGAQISEAMETSRITAWVVVLRTVIIDDYIHKLVREGAVDMVINLGAGLDTRPYRLTLPADFPWIEVDFQHMIDFKNEKLKDEKPVCRLERVAVDLSDVSARQKFFTEISARTKKALVLTEGVLPYLSEAQVADLGEALHKVPSFLYWIVDYQSADTQRFLQTAKRKEQMKNAPFLFFPADWFGFFKNIGWKPKETRYIAEEGERLKRAPPFPWIIRMIGRFLPKDRQERHRKMSGYFLMERG